jgi:hypothetical protein
VFIEAIIRHCKAECDMNNDSSIRLCLKTTAQGGPVLNSQCLMPVVKKTSEEDPVHG